MFDVLLCHLYRVILEIKALEVPKELLELVADL